jgi:hypothetical protein
MSNRCASPSRFLHPRWPAATWRFRLPGAGIPEVAKLASSPWRSGRRGGGVGGRELAGGCGVPEMRVVSCSPHEAVMACRGTYARPVTWRAGGR